MKTIHFARQALLATGIAGAVLASLAAGPVVAGHGLLMKEHPLRGDFPAANSETEAAVPATGAATAEARPAARQRHEPGGWLRGDFPMAAESQAEPVTVVTRDSGQTWTCSVDQARAQIADPDATRVVMRVIQLNP
jgi:nucleoside phosphorylase